MGQMPTNCNGIALIDNSKDFCKANCQWVKTRSGRPQKAKLLNRKKRDVKSKIKKPKSICLVLENTLLDKIKVEAYNRSLDEGYCIETNDVIRSTLEDAFK
jgi:hypothetical protein